MRNVWRRTFFIKIFQFKSPTKMLNPHFKSSGSACVCVCVKAFLKDGYVSHAELQISSCVNGYFTSEFAM